MQIHVEKLTKYYDGKLVLDIPKMELEAGKVYAVVGPNGAGKTTLLNLLAGLDEPTSGAITFHEQTLETDLKSITDIRRRVTLVMQDPVLFHTTVEKNVAYGLRVRGVDKHTRTEKVSEALKMVGLSGFEKRKAYQLSSGETRRVALARALILEPKALLLDEPTANIDRRNAEVIETLIQRIKSEQQSIIVMTTHDLSQAYRLADTVVSLVFGRVINSSPENIFSGHLEDGSNGFKRLSLAPSVVPFLQTEHEGNVHVCINPKRIHLSNQPQIPDSLTYFLSCKDTKNIKLNSFHGNITAIISESEWIRVKIDVGVEFVALMPKDDFYHKNLNIGKSVYISFQPSDMYVISQN